jgi:hypothetical protein
MNSKDVFEFEFLPLRAKLLEIAATIDRLERDAGSIDDPRMARVRHSMEILLEQNGDRAEQIQMVFSRAYDEDWSKKFGLTL